MAEVSFLGYRLQTGPAAAIAAELLKPGPCRMLACLNPHSWYVARSDPLFARALQQADFLLPDGIGVVLGARFLGHDIKARVTGADLFAAVMQDLNRSGGRVYFLGSTPRVLSLIAEKLARDYPHIVLCGSHSPRFTPAFSADEQRHMLRAIQAAAPDVLWVGMTAPKQEKWILENQAQLPVRFAGAIGAVFDFYAGTVPRSPLLFQRLGLEWLPRLLRQPRRLWRRMFISAPVFIGAVLRARRGS